MATSGAHVLLPLSLLVAGCSDHLTKIGETDQQANIDLFQCKRENRNAGDGSVVGPNGEFAPEELVRNCMRARDIGSK
jgi:hypothetical protein